MKIFFILFFYVLWSGKQEAHSFSQQDIAFLNCREEDKKACLKKAKDRVQGLIEHIEDALDNMNEKMANFSPCGFNIEFAGSENMSMEEFRQKEISYWKDLIERIRAAEQKDGLFQELIEKLLKDRLKDLAGQKILSEQIEEKQDGAISITVSAAFMRRQDDGKSKIENLKKELKKFHSSIDIDVYDVWNEFIIDFLSLTILHKLPDETKRLIAASPSLHLKIKDRTIELGGLSEHLKHQDACLHNDHIALTNLSINCYAGFYKFQQKFPMTLFEHQKIMGIASRKKKIAPLEFPDFLKDLSQTSSASMEFLDELEPEAKVKKKRPSKFGKKNETRPLEAITEIFQTILQENDPELTEPVQETISQEPKPTSPAKAIAAIKSPPPQSKAPQPEQLEFLKKVVHQSPQLKKRHLQTHETMK